MRKIIFIIAVTAIILQSCAPSISRLSAYPKMYEEKPITIMIMPPVNKSTKVDAKMSFYNTLAMPLADNGYYALPPSLCMSILQDQSAYDAEELMDKSMKVVGEAFGADAVLFTIIHEWRKLTIGSSVEVRIEYLLKSTDTDEILYNRIGNIRVNASSNSGNPLADLAVMMIKTALTKEVTVSQRCNNYTFQDIPKGKYSTYFNQDSESPAGLKEFNVTINQ